MGASGPATPWLTGPALARQLAEPVAVVQWSGTRLRQVVQGISANSRVAILLDRRVDPDRGVTLSLRDAPLEKVLAEIADGQGIGMTLCGPVVYLGPPETARRLRTLLQLRREEAGAAGEAAGPLAKSARMRWDDLAMPRELLSGLAEEAEVELEGRERVPHDLWAAGDLPALPWVDRFGLVAVQFDLTFQIRASGKSVRLMPIPDRVAIVREYPLGADPEEQARKFSAQAPGSEVKVLRDKVLVRGLIEDHERLGGVRRPAPGKNPPARPPRRGEKVYTIKESKGPLRRVLEQIATSLSLEVKFDEEAFRRAGVSLDQPVSFSAREASLDQLLHAVVDPAGCSFRKRGQVIEVFPTPAGPEKE